MSLTGLREMVVLARGNVGDDRVMVIENKLIFGGLFFFCYFCGVNSGVPDALRCGLLVCVGGRG